MPFLTEILAFLVVALLIHLFIKWLTSQLRSMNTFRQLSIPGPKPSLVTGNFREFLRADLKHETLDRWAKQYGHVFGYYQGAKPFLVLSDIEDVQEVVTKLGKSFPNRQQSNINVEPFASSLLGLRGDQWRNSRRVLTPPFTAHKMALKTTKTAINESVKRFLVALEQQRRKSLDNEIDVLRNMQSVTLDVISRLAFNMQDTDDLYEDNSKLRKITTEFMENSANSLLQLATYFPFLQRVAALAYNLFGGGQLIDHIMEHLNKCVIEYYQKRIRQKFGDSTVGETKDKDTKVNILDFMLEQQEQGNLSNAITILIAGYETTATGLTFTLYLLAKHQDIQTRLRAEILRKHTEQDNFCHFDYNRCELLDRVWYESLRLYPPVVAFMTRELDDNIEQVQLTKSQIPVTKEMTVQIPTWTIHHNADYWPNPNQFDPSRENLPIPGSIKPNHAFLPFGSGPRNCIGSNLANSEARAVLTAILSQYKVDLVRGDRSKDDPETGLLRLTCKTVVIKPEVPLYLRLIPITDL